MRIPNPFNKKSLVALGAIGAALAVWRIRSRRRDSEDQQFEDEIQSAVNEGTGAGHPAP